MGVNASASLVAGVRYADAVEQRVVRTTVTRYDELTGKPHEKAVDTRQFFLFGHKITGQDVLSAGRELPEVMGWKHVRMYYPNSDYAENWVLGVAAAEADDYRTKLVVVDEPVLAEAKAKLLVDLGPFGLKPEAVRFYLIQYLG